MKRFLSFILLTVAAFLGACSSDADVGDGCGVSTDCSKTGEMVCETSLPGGYCTVVGCTEDSCPGGSVCVAFYPDESLGSECDPATEDVTTDDCPPGQVCLLYGRCADPTTSVTYCMDKCSSDSDCRGGYSCITTGEFPDEPVSTTYPHAPVSYCGVTGW